MHSVNGDSVADGGSRDVVIRAAIERVRRSPFYARHLAGSECHGLSDLARLPLTFKDHLRDASPYGMLAVRPEQAWHYHETSGTTGEPIATWCGLPEVQRMGEIVHAMVPELSRPTLRQIRNARRRRRLACEGRSQR